MLHADSIFNIFELICNRSFQFDVCDQAMGHEGNVRVTIASRKIDILPVWLNAAYK